MHAPYLIHMYFSCQFSRDTHFNFSHATSYVPALSKSQTALEEYILSMIYPFLHSRLVRRPRLVQGRHMEIDLEDLHAIFIYCGIFVQNPQQILDARSLFAIDIEYEISCPNNKSASI